ncbi:MAG: hypothetical protein ABSE57_04295 [Bryobacteraceae bacterium]
MGAEERGEGKEYQEYEGIRGIRALAISFNTDDKIALAESFAKSHGYTFPVLGTKQYAEDLMPLMAIPRTWIIKNGVIAAE